MGVIRSTEVPGYWVRSNKSGGTDEVTTGDLGRWEKHNESNVV